MKESPEELEQKAARYRQLARHIGDKPTVDRILTLAQELEQQAQPEVGPPPLPASFIAHAPP